MSHQHHHRRGEPKFEFGKTSNHKEPEYEYGKKYSKEGGGGGGGNTEEETKTAPKEKEKPTLALSGNLAKDTNTFNGVVVKYNEPPEARKPIKRWRLYCFKGETELPFYPMHRQSAYLFGRDRLVADIPVEHPSCSKQHAVFQYRMVEYRRKDGTTGRTIKPYLIDLGSTNGSFINNNQIEPQRYVELREKDVLKFGFSSREYVLLHEESKNDLESDTEDYREGEEESSGVQTDEVKVKTEKRSSSSSSQSEDDEKKKSKKQADKTETFKKKKYSSSSESSSSESESKGKTSSSKHKTKKKKSKRDR